jgi:hypothetical protein
MKVFYLNLSLTILIIIILIITLNGFELLKMMIINMININMIDICHNFPIKLILIDQNS